MTTGKQRLDRQGAVPYHCNSKLCVDQPQVYQTLSCFDAAFQILQASTQLITVSNSWTSITRRALRFLIWHCSLVPRPLFPPNTWPGYEATGTAPCVSAYHYVTPPYTIPDKTSQVFPLHFLHTVSNHNWRQGRTGNEAKAVSVAMYSGFASTFCLLQH